MTAADLLRALAPYRPTVEGDELLLDREPPDDLVGPLGTLHTGVRALLARRQWWGCRSADGHVVPLNPAIPIPEDITLLCVEGDHTWDRIHGPAPEED